MFAGEVNGQGRMAASGRSNGPPGRGIWHVGPELPGGVMCADHRRRGTAIGEVSVLRPTMTIIIDTIKLALLTAIAWTFAGVGVAVTRVLRLGWHAAHRPA